MTVQAVPGLLGFRVKGLTRDGLVSGVVGVYQFRVKD